MAKQQTRQEWAKRIERWKDSGLTAAEFAAETGISAKSLSWWRWNLSTNAPEEATKQPSLETTELSPTKPAILRRREGASRGRARRVISKRVSR